MCVICSVADPDPVGSGLFLITRIRTLYPLKDPVNCFFIKILFLSLISSVIRCLHLVGKCHNTIFLLNIRIRILTTGSANPDPRIRIRKKLDQIHHSGYMYILSVRDCTIRSSGPSIGSDKLYYRVRNHSLGYGTEG